MGADLLVTSGFSKWPVVPVQMLHCSGAHGRPHSPAERFGTEVGRGAEERAAWTRRSRDLGVKLMPAQVLSQLIIT